MGVQSFGIGLMRALVRLFVINFNRDSKYSATDFTVVAQCLNIFVYFCWSNESKFIEIYLLMN